MREHDTSDLAPDAMVEQIFGTAVTRVTAAADGRSWLVIPIDGKPYAPGDSMPVDNLRRRTEDELRVLRELLQTVPIDDITDAVRATTVANLEHDPAPTPWSFWKLAADEAIDCLIQPILRRAAQPEATQ